MSKEKFLKMVIMTYGFMQHLIKKEKKIHKGQVLIFNNINSWGFLIILEYYISHIAIGSMLVPIQIFSLVTIYFLGKEHLMAYRLDKENFSQSVLVIDLQLDLKILHNFNNF